MADIWGVSAKTRRDKSDEMNAKWSTLLSCLRVFCFYPQQINIWCAESGFIIVTLSVSEPIMAELSKLAMVLFITQSEALEVAVMSDAWGFIVSREGAPSLVTSEWTPFVAILSGVANH